MRLYFKYVKILIKSLAEYRMSFWLTLTAQFIKTTFSFFGIYLLFQRFGTLAGWSFAEIALCFAVVQMAFALSECFVRGFDVFKKLVITGDFDRLLLRPRGTVLQVLGTNFEFSRLGRIVQAIAVFIIALTLIDVDFTVLKGLTLVLMVISGFFIFSGLFILGACMCFFTTDSLEIVNIFTDGGREIAAYPLDIYSKGMKRFFTFIVPFGCFNYLPLMYILDKAGSNSILYMLTPLLGILFIVPCLLLWNFGVKKYIGAGS